MDMMDGMSKSDEEELVNMVGMGMMLGAFAFAAKKLHEVWQYIHERDCWEWWEKYCEAAS